MKPIAIATEDQISECIAHKLVEKYTTFTVDLNLGRKGNGHLKNNLKSYYEIARDVMPFLLMTDLDKAACAPTLINSWEKNVNFPQPNSMLFRVAVREAEAWLLADHENFSSYLGINKMPTDIESILDPKEALINLAKKAPRAIRDDILPPKGSKAIQGLGYNARLIEFTNNLWNPENARVRSDSLHRVCTRLAELEAG